MLNRDRFSISPNLVGGIPPLNLISVGDYFFSFAFATISNFFSFLSNPVLSINPYPQKWAALAEKVCENSHTRACRSDVVNNNPGGKVKPLKAAKKEKKDLDEDEIAFQAKQRAGMFYRTLHRLAIILTFYIDAKAKKDMMEAAKGKKGPLNTGQQGIKKSGKK